MLDHENAMKLWEKLLGDATEACDKKGRLIYKEAYGQHGSNSGWDIHHIIPKSQGGTDDFDNMEIIHVITHDEIHKKH